MEKTNQIDFLKWLRNRLIYKHLYENDNSVIRAIDILCNELVSQYECSISDTDLDLILSKYYVDFFLEGSDDSTMGFSDKQRNDLRSTTRNIINDVVNKRIPKEPVIKG